MSFRIGKISVIAAEPDGRCELCGSIAETRPYGPNGERICYECGQKNLAVTERQMRRVLFGEETQ
jgi:hypothetical protein